MAELAVNLTYGMALFEAASELDKVDAIFEEMRSIETIFDENPSFYEFFITPRISKTEKKETVKKIFEGKISTEVLNFLYILLDKRRAMNYREIVKQYAKIVAESRNISEGTIFSANPLKQEQIEAFQEKVAALVRKKVRLENKVDPSIIGGVKIFIGDKVIDATVKNKLQSLKESLDAVIV